MKTWTCFFFMFCLGLVAVFYGEGAKLSDAVNTEERIQAAPVEDRLALRQQEDLAQVEISKELNDWFLTPGFILVVIGLVGWFAFTRPHRGRMRLEDFPGRADPNIFDKLGDEARAYFERHPIP